MARDSVDLKHLESLANKLRIQVVKMIGKFGYGHIGGSMSIVEIVSVLYFHELNLDRKNPKFEDRDRFILSKGHGCFTQYAALAEIGYISKEMLARVYQIDSPLQGHPEYGSCPGIEISTGALGQGLSAGIGMAIGARLRNKKFRVYVVLGDGELDEGQVWEGAMSAPKYKLDNLVAIIDSNENTLSGRTEEVMPVEPLHDKWVSFGWHVIEVDGHSIKELVHALDEARDTRKKPTLIIAHTVKAKGIPFLEGKWQSHATPFTTEQAKDTLKKLGCTEKEIESALS